MQFACLVTNKADKEWGVFANHLHVHGIIGKCSAVIDLQAANWFEVHPSHSKNVACTDS